MRVILLTVFALFSFATSFAQADGDYRSAVASGDWDQPGSWEVFSGGAWIPAIVAPTSADEIITIGVGHTITVTSDVTVDQIEFGNDFSGTTGTIIIASGATLSVANGPGDDIRLFNDFFSIALIQVEGTLDLLPGATMIEDDGFGTLSPVSNFTYAVMNGGVHIHNTGVGVDQIPNADWQTGSTCRVRALGANVTLTIDPSTIFYNFEWDGTAQTAVHNLNGSLINVNNDLLIEGTNGSPLQFATTTNYVLDVAGDFTISGNSRVFLEISGTATVNVGGNFIISSTLNLPNAITFATTGTTTVNVAGNFTKSNASGVLLGAAPTGSGTLNLNGDFTFSAGTLNRGGSGTGVSSIVFDGSTTQLYSNTGGSFGTGAINYIVAPGVSVDLGTSVLGGTNGTFTNNGTVRVGSPNAMGAIQGNIPVSTRIFNIGSTVIYGTGAQFMGAAHPTESGVNTIIDNSAGVSLAANVTIGGDLTMTSGNLTVGARTLTLGGIVTANGNTINTTSGSSIVINGSGAFGTFPFPAGPQSLSAFTLNRPGGSVTFADDVSLSGNLVLNNGNLVFAGQTLTLAGTITSSGGALSSDNTSTLVVNGGGAFGTLSFASGGNTLNTLTFNRTSSGTGSIGNTLIITNELNLVQGTLTNSGGLTLDDGVTVTRTSNAQLTGSEILTQDGDMYNVVYTGSGAITTGIETPETGGQNSLRSLTIDAPVTLTKHITVNGDVDLISGSLDAATFNIRLEGSPGTWTRAAGTFIPGTGTVIVDGDITVVATSTPQAGNLSIVSGATLTNPAGVLNISGNLSVNAGATFNNNNGTVVFNGANNQSFGGGGKTFNNITVNKSGGILQLISPVSMAGLLTVQTETEVQSNGNLTLLSTSDAATGNASIGPLPANASITGSVNVRRYMSDEGRIYRYISSAVQGTTGAHLQTFFSITGTFDGADPCPDCDPSMYSWNESIPGDLTVGYEQFPAVANTETMEVGRGYAAFIRDNLIPGNVTINYSGVINSGTINLPVTYNASGNGDADGYNLVGNPYPSSIYWDDPNWTKTNVSSTIAVRDNGTGNVLYWDGQSGGVPDGVIATGQGFWVRATAASPVLTIREDVKTSQTGIFFRENQRQEPINALAISLKSGDMEDVAYYKVRKNAKPELDDLDAPKLDNVIFDISTLTPEGLSMAINATDKPLCGETLQLLIKDVQNGNYRLSSQALGLFTGYQVTLVDKYTNSNIELSSDQEYNFSVTDEVATKSQDRFSIILTEPVIDPGNLIAETGSASCGDGSYEVSLTGAQQGVYYFAELDGKVLGDSVIASGSDPVVLSVPADRLTLGSNNLTVKGFNYCTTVAMNSVVTIDHDELYNVTSSDATGCAEGQVTLEASGAPANGSYNWYEEETSATPIEGEHQSTFMTPSLSKAKTYYVAAVNSKGCEGPRVAVKASVMPYEPVQIDETIPGQLSSSYETGNQWYLDGEPIDGATGQTLSVMQSGTYTVEVDLGGCITTADVDFLVTEVDELNPERLFNAYANPFADILKVRVVSSGKVDQMSVYDNLGSKVGDMKLTRDPSETEGYIDMTRSASGMYFVKTLMDGRVYTLKVIKK